jgi:ATP-dependent DNA helicase RecQ
VGLQTFLTASKAPEQALGEVAHALERHDKPVRPGQLKQEVTVAAVTCTRAVNLLEQAGVVATTADGRLEYLNPALSAAQAVDQTVDAAEIHQRLVRSRIQMMRGYAETTGCRRQYLLGYLGEQLPHLCGNCDTCAAGTTEEQPAGDDWYPLNSSVRHTEWGHGTVMSIEQDRLTVLFDDVGYKTLSRSAVRKGGLLSLDDEAFATNEQRGPKKQT